MCLSQVFTHVLQQPVQATMPVVISCQKSRNPLHIIEKGSVLAGLKRNSFLASQSNEMQFSKMVVAVMGDFKADVARQQLLNHNNGTSCQQW